MIGGIFLKKKIVFLILASMILETGIANAEELTFRERVQNILGTNPFSKYYKPNIVSNNSKMELSKDIDKDIESKNLISEATNLRKKLMRLVEQNTSFREVKPFEQEVNEEVVDVIEDESLDVDFQKQEKSDCVYYDYKNGSKYEINTCNGYITDIMLEIGEEVERITLGDNERWDIRTCKDSESRYHIYVQPMQNDICTNMIISTDKRNYQLMLNSNGIFEGMVAWKYPNTFKEENIKVKREITVERADQLNFEYQFNKIDKGPQFVFNDGKNTYLSFDPEEIHSINPAIFTINRVGNLELLDYEKYNNTIVIDGVYKSLEIINNGKTINIDYVHNS